ncbi:hypothetical protein SAMN02745824_0253 [Parasphingorhabdus marina DSM 22363]|uniref:Uncharacterized protein n=1 Tax=Parasphingorhabdus marina DSM 22363 TaxID=1123272 RepID=A0A1N6CMB7_9SPHN|nr:hypothetical protein [Parasphingorhabdus marina]SIN59720.1 hypothetical protein SAMN02745824_0253 [Parasphingorhabdus marina DSM 22363]
MRMLTPLLIGSLVAAGGVAYAGKSSSKDDKYVITEIGEPENCIRRSQIRSTDVISDSIIDFKMRGGDIYRNTLPNRCSGLAFEEAFSYRTSVNQLCSVDIIRVIDNSGGGIRERNACGLGKFQKIEKTKKADTEG